MPSLLYRSFVYTVGAAYTLHNHHAHLVGRGLAGIGVALRVGVEVLIVGVVVDVVAVVVVVGVAHEEVDNVEDGEEEGDQAERAHPGAGCNSPTFFRKN